MSDAGSPSGPRPGSGWGPPPTGWSGPGSPSEHGTGWGAGPTPGAGAGPSPGATGPSATGPSVTGPTGPGAVPPGGNPGLGGYGPSPSAAGPAGPAGPGGPHGPGQPPSGWGDPRQPVGWQTPPQWGGGPAWGAPQAPKPGVVPLRPLNLGELLDGAFTTVQRYPKIMLGMSAIVMTALTVLSFAGFSAVGLSDLATASPEEVARTSDTTWLALFGTVIGISLVAWLGGTILTGMITVTVAQGVLGRPMSVREAWDGCRPHILRLLGLSLLLGIALAIALVLLIAFVALGFAIHVGLGALALLVSLGVGIGGAIVLWARTAAAVPALVLETRPAEHPGERPQRLSVIAALQRSWNLVKGRTGRTFGTLFVANIIAGIVASVVQTAFTFLSAGLGVGLDEVLTADPLTTESGILPVVVISIGYVASAVLQVAFLSGVNALIYVDARMRKEGLDIELAQAAAGRDSGPLWTTR